MRSDRPRSRRRQTEGDYFSPAAPRVLAHRGLALEAPENTMLAFLKALSIGADYLETDVHVSRDGVAVIAHDPDLTRVAGRPERVDELTMAELRKVRLGEDQGFCSLVEALDAFPDARFNIDIKCEAAVGATVEAITESGATKRVLIASFKGRRRRQALKRLPGVATSASSEGSAVAFVAASLGLRPVVRLALRGVDAVQLPYRFKGVRVITPRLVAAMHATGVEVHAWTINSVPQMTELLEMGVDGIVTDRADLALSLTARD
jgi:glycerophosphoryl diester phosphodiesterase